MRRRLPYLCAHTTFRCCAGAAAVVGIADPTSAAGRRTTTPTTSALSIADPTSAPTWPMFAVLSPDGRTTLAPDASAHVPPRELAVKLYRAMVRTQALDDIFFQAQRQGRISFYLTSTGEEALQVGSGAALTLDDTVFAQYREVGVLLWRGFTVQQCADQCVANVDDLGKGRMMPIHYGSKALNFHTISSPLGTQIPQAVGAAYALKMDRKRAVAMVYFGEGAASEGDFHAGLNMAATLEAPVLFFCRNNGYAISTPTKEQFRGDGVVSRAAGYGMHAVRVDGNDAFAVYAAVRAAREVAVTHSKPVLIEAMTYRRGHHSTSDDSTRYRSVEEIKAWQEHRDPVKRLRTYLHGRGWWTDTEETALRDAERLAVITALEAAERKPKPPLSMMFEDVYKEKPPHLARQEAALHQHLRLHPEHHPHGTADSH